MVEVCNFILPSIHPHWLLTAWCSTGDYCRGRIRSHSEIHQWPVCRHGALSS
jgi:hypothetical protein